MSKIGNKPVQIPSTVEVDIQNNKVNVKGKDGALTVDVLKEITVTKENNILYVKRTSDAKHIRALHGLFRSLIANAVAGVEKPWEKRMEIVGTGFNVKLQGEDLFLKLGFSHPIVFKKIDGISFAVEGNNKIVVKGADKQLVGQIAYQIRILRKPDAYKGKGIKYEGEHLRIKPGKKAKAAGAAGAA